jgi:hypothetical protein
MSILRKMFCVQCIRTSSISIPESLQVLYIHMALDFNHCCNDKKVFLQTRFIYTLLSLQLQHASVHVPCDLICYNINDIKDRHRNEDHLKVELRELDVTLS